MVLCLKSLREQKAEWEAQSRQCCKKGPMVWQDSLITKIDRSSVVGLVDGKKARSMYARC